MAGGHITIPSVMDIYEVAEMFSRYYVDPVIAQQHVPPKWKVKIHENGMAYLYVLIQKSQRMVLDKIFNMGPVGMSHIWIELDGPPEVITPFPGTDRALPTWYWYTLPHQFDSQLANLFVRVAGIATQSIREISHGGDPGGSRSGKVIESYSPETSYSWTETSQLYPEPDIITGSHRLYRQYGVRESAAHVKCITHFLGDGQVILNASPDSAIGKLGFGTRLTGTSNPVLVKHCRIEYKVGFF
ncbi:MAG: hypothetical protein ABRQ24_03355 [Syntrophomonadaceae bacterium]